LYKINKVENTTQFLEDNMSQEFVAVDTETTSLYHKKDEFKIFCITMSFNGVDGYYLPFENINKRLLNRFFKNKYTITAGGKFDVKGFLVSGISTFKVSEDIIILYHMLNTCRQHNSLKSLAWLIGFGGYDQALEDYKTKYKVKNYSEIPESLIVNYSVLDAIVTFKLWEDAKENLIPKQKEIYKAYKDIIIPLIPLYSEMELEGLDVDIDYLNKLDTDFKVKKEELENQIKKIIGRDIDVSSNEQVAIELERLGLPNANNKVTKKGVYQTGDEFLQIWKSQGFEIADLILQHRKITKIMSGFLRGIEKKKEKSNSKESSLFAKSQEVKKEKGLIKSIINNKVYSNYGIAITAPLRQSCSDINIQQFPKDKELRKVFKCSDDYTFTEFDISGFHLRLMAYFSKDKNMREVFINGNKDLHSYTARNIFARNLTLQEFLKVKNEEPYKTYRFKAKGINFLLLYLGKPYSLKKTIDVEWALEDVNKYIDENKCKILEFNGIEDKSYTVAKDIYNKFMNLFPGISVYVQEQISKARKLGYLDSDLFGCRRHLPELFFTYTDVDNYQKREFEHLYSICSNTEILSTEALIMDIAMLKIYNEFKERNLKSKLVLMVHDSVAVKTYKPETETVRDICMKHLQEFVLDDIKIEAEGQVGDIWGFGDEICLK